MQRNLGPPIGAAALALALSGCGTATAAPGQSSGAGAPGRPAPCPPKPRARLAPDPWPPAHRELAPPGVATIRLCRYTGVNSQPRLRLTRSVLIRTRGTVTSLARAFDQLPELKGPIGCPVDDDSRILALLAYPRGHRVTIDMHLRGCNQVTNGNLTRTALRRPGPKLIARLEQLAP